MRGLLFEARSVEHERTKVAKREGSVAKRPRPKDPVFLMHCVIPFIYECVLWFLESPIQPLLNPNNKPVTL